MINMMERLFRLISVKNAGAYVKVASAFLVLPYYANRDKMITINLLNTFTAGKAPE